MFLDSYKRKRRVESSQRSEFDASKLESPYWTNIVVRREGKNSFIIPLQMAGFGKARQ
jgi:hypothetical protein